MSRPDKLGAFVSDYFDILSRRSLRLQPVGIVLDIADFADFVLNRLRQKFPAKQFQPGEHLATIRCGEVLFGLTNLHAQYEQSGLSDDEFAEGVVESFEKMLGMVDATADPISDTWGQSTVDLIEIAKAN